MAFVITYISGLGQNCHKNIRNASTKKNRIKQTMAEDNKKKRKRGKKYDK